MKRALIILALCVLCFQAGTSFAKEETPCTIEKLTEKVDSLRNRPFFSDFEGILKGQEIDTVYCLDSTIEIWMLFTLEPTGGAHVPFNDLAWYSCLLKFCMSVRDVFQIFDASKYRVVVFLPDEELPEGTIVTRKVPIAKFRMNIETFRKRPESERVGHIWKYFKAVYEGEGYDRYRNEILGLLDAYWVDKKYLK